MEQPKQGFFQVPSNGAVIGILIGVAIVVVMTITGPSERDDTVFVDVGSPAEVKAFVDDWDAMTRASWYVESEFTRIVDDHEVFRASSVHAQRPPDSVRVSGGTVTVSMNGQRKVCSQSIADAAATCREVGPYDYEAERQRELAAVRAAVSGPDARYGVMERSDQCHQLRPTTRGLSGGTDVLQWGSDAVFCFDSNTSAMVTSRITRDEGFDVTTAYAIRGTVTDEDLQRLSLIR